MPSLWKVAGTIGRGILADSRAFMQHRDTATPGSETADPGSTATLMHCDSETEPQGILDAG